MKNAWLRVLLPALVLVAAAPGGSQEPVASPGILCRARPGETLASIARDHSIPVETLARNSFLEPAARLDPGQALLLLPEAADWSALGEEFVRPAMIEAAIQADLDGDPEEEVGLIGTSWERDHTQQLVFLERRGGRWKGVRVYQVKQNGDPCRMTFSPLISGRPQVVISGREGLAADGIHELYTLIVGWSGSEGLVLFRELEYSRLETAGEKRVLESEFGFADRDSDGLPEIERVVHYRIQDGGKTAYEDRSKESFHWDPRQRTFYGVDQEVEKLASPNRVIRQRSCERLAKSGSRAPATAVEPLLNDEYPEVQRAAAHTLGEIGSRSSVEPIVARLKKIPPPELACDLLEALGEIGDRRSAETVKFFMEHKESYVRGYARVAASHLGLEIPLADLLSCLDEAPDHLKALAVQELTRRTKNDFGTDWNTREELAETLARWREWGKENAGK